MSSEPTEPQPPAKPPPVRYQPTPRRPPQPPPPAKKEIVIGGLKVFVYGLDKVKDEIPRVVLFLLHGRGGDHTQFEEFIESLDLKSINRNRTRRQLLICTFDERNHGTRCVDPNLNLEFDENPTHAMDMFSVMYGTVKEINILIDLLPGYLYPCNEDGIVEWGVLGVSQGAHAAWMALAQVERKVHWGCSVGGCPDFNNLMEIRLAEFGLKPTYPYLPEHFMRIVRRLDLGSVLRRRLADDPEGKYRDQITRILQKPILVLSGRNDEMVPLDASAHVVGKLQELVGKSITVKVYDGIGHEFSKSMQDDFKTWLTQLLDVKEAEPKRLST